MSKEPPSAANEPPRQPEYRDRLDDDMVRILQGMTPAQRLAIAHGMWRSARDMLTNLTRAEHPDWSDEQVGREVARRLSHGEVPPQELTRFIG
jgi:hypothetical protein